MLIKKQHLLTSLRKTERNIFGPSGLVTGVFEELPYLVHRECLMSRIGLSQTVLPNRISCLCVESIRRIRRTPVFGVRGAASARSALSFRCKQVCLDSFFTRNTFVAGFFYPFFPPSPPIRAVLPRLVTLSHSTHFGPGENLRIFTYKILPMPNAPKDGENPKKGSISGVFCPKKRTKQ